MNNTLLRFLVAAMVLGGCGAGSTATDGDSWLGTSTSVRTYEIRGGMWWDGAAFRPRTVYSVGGVFSSHAPARVDSVIDASGGFVVPPFAEAHTHTIAYVPTRIVEFLEQGVFYALILNVHRHAIGENFTWFNRPNSVDVNFATAAITASDGHPIQIGLRGQTTSRELDGDWVTIVDSPEDLEAKWPALRQANPSIIKVFLLYSERYAERHGDESIPTRYKGMNPDLVPDIVRRAHEAGLRVAAHVRTAHDFHVAVEAGVDIVAHLPGFSMGPTSLESLQDSERVAEVDHPERFRIAAQDAEMAAQRNIAVITTIGSAGEVPTGLPEDIGEQVRRMVEIRRQVLIDNLRMLRTQGVRIAVGSDAGEGSPVKEALELNRLGVFDPPELLDMLTRVSTQLIFPRRSVGRLDDGYEASFLVLNADPTEDLENIRRLRLRFKQGAPLDPRTAASIAVP